jgi:hypothetical protein
VVLGRAHQGTRWPDVERSNTKTGEERGDARWTAIVSEPVHTLEEIRFRKADKLPGRITVNGTYRINEQDSGAVDD